MSDTGHVFYKIIKIEFPSGLLIDNVNLSFLVYIVSVSLLPVLVFSFPLLADC